MIESPRDEKERVSGEEAYPDNNADNGNGFAGRKCLRVFVDFQQAHYRTNDPRKSEGKTTETKDTASEPPVREAARLEAGRADIGGLRQRRWRRGSQDIGKFGKTRK